MSRSISKSKYLAGLQCPKRLWLEINTPDQVPAPSAATQAIFDQGHQVGELAHQLFPGGVLIDWDNGFGNGLAESRRLIAERRPLSEAGFVYGGALAKADVLNPVGEDEWDLIEVKSSTEVKDVNIHDVALQRHCYEGAGLRIRRCFLMHINNQYVRHGAVDPKGLFAQEDVTDRVAELMGGVEGRLADMAKTVAQPECPVVDIGPHCTEPYDCPMKEKCWAHVLQYEDHIFTLPRIRNKGWELYRRGILRNRDIPPDVELTEHQRIQVAAERTGQMHVEGRKLIDFLCTMEYPLYFLDFETFSTAIPLVDGVRPYQKVPFQFSLHVVSEPASDPVHHSWIWDRVGHPQAVMLDRLKPLLGEWGSIIAYNATFEQGVLKDAREAFPEKGTWARYIGDRFVDLLTPFRERLVYHPAQDGSNSLKAVVPVLTEQYYEGREIADGDTASRRYLAAMFTDVDPAERQRTMRLLEEYCGVDTMAMVELVWNLGKCA